MNCDVRAKLRAQSSAVDSDTAEDYKKARYDLSKAIRETKKQYRQKLRVCSSELADVLADIFNLSLAQASVPTCFKTDTIVPVSKQSTMTCLNDYRPIALTPITLKCFERTVMTYTKKTIPDNMDPLQFAYRQNRSTDDTVNTAIQTDLTHLEGKDTYVRM